MKKFPTIIIVCLLFNITVYSQEKTYKLEGDIHYRNDGNIYVYLVNEDIFKTPFTGIQDTIIIPTESKGKIIYSFDNIPSGVFGIRCFQDLDGNNKLNKGMFGPSEPWGMSWQVEKPAKWPKFKDISFKIDADIVVDTIYLE